MQSRTPSRKKNTHEFRRVSSSIYRRIKNVFKRKSSVVLPLIYPVLALILLISIAVRMPIIESLSGTAIESIVTSQKFADVSSSILSSIVAAYIFYLVIDYFPKRRKRKEILTVMNSLIASILDAYRRERVFGHETAISQVNLTCLNKDWLINQRKTLQENHSRFLALKFSTETADSRLEDFRISLSLAMQISPERAQHWLVIIDKTRLLAENCNRIPEIMKKSTLEPNADAEALKSTSNFRFLEFVDESYLWLHGK